MAIKEMTVRNVLSYCKVGEFGQKDVIKNALGGP